MLLPPPPLALCGSCALAAQVRERRSAGATDLDRVFPSLHPARDVVLLRRLASEAGSPVKGWHALRRGMASDLQAAGAPVSVILAAGVWRSSAVLRYLVSSEVGAQATLDLALADSASESDG